MIPTFNDEDVISEVLENLLHQGTFPVVLDNGSTDNTFNICKKFSERGDIKLNKFNSEFYNESKILEILHDMALIENPDWLVLCNSDELLESGLNDCTIGEAISQIDSAGFNLIQFNRFDFFMSDDDKPAKTIKEKLTYYSYQDDYLYRSWKFVPGVRMHGGGHYPLFPEGEKYNIYPRKFVMRHYTFRNKEQAEKKMQDRINKNVGGKSRELLSQHVLNALNHGFTKCVDYKILSKYNEDNHWNLERKYAPFVVDHPKRNDMFSENGLLKLKPKSIEELLFELIKREERVIRLQNRIKLLNEIADMKKTGKITDSEHHTFSGAQYYKVGE